MKVWDERFASRKDEPLLEAFNASIVQDRFLYRAEIKASLAYAECLHGAAVLTADELASIRAGLEQVKRRIDGGEDLSRFEDIHSAVELMLTEEAGEVGQKLHTGRSRNEQVATDEKLYLKEKIPAILQALTEIQEEVIRLAEAFPDVVMPGYTHLQQGQCVLFSHYVMALFWPLERGKQRLRDALIRMDTLPLGVGALAGSTVDINRQALAESLGFQSVSENSMDTTADRAFILEILFDLSLILLDLGRFSEDCILFASREFDLLSFDDEIVTSSSLMPQKRNPDIFELVRAASGRMFGHCTQLFITMKGLPLTYNKDMQEDKLPLQHGIEEALDVLKVFRYCLMHMKPNATQMRKDLDSFLFATDLVDDLTEKGEAFREAHAIVGRIVAWAEKRGKALDSLTLDEFRQFHHAFDEHVFEVFDPIRSLQRKKTAGSTHPARVTEQIEKAKRCV